MASNNLPFKTDYAKSSRSKCHTTKAPITPGTLRFATMVKSRNFDGMQPNWNDAEAFLTMKTRRKRPHSVDEIDGFDDLRPEDQEKMEKWIQTYTDTQGNDDTKATKHKQAVREQAALVWKVRDLTAGEGDVAIKALPPATIKAILSNNKIPIKGNSDLIKTLAEIFVFGVPPFGNSVEGCCESQPLRFCPHSCRYVCKAAQAWGECTYSQPVEDTECTEVKLPKLKGLELKWLEAVEKVCDGPKKRLFIEKKITVAQITPAVSTSKKKRPPPSKSAPPVKRGKFKPSLSRACMDPDCGLDEGRFHVLDESNGSGDPKEAFPTDLFDVTLCMTDLSTGINSQYKLQILVPDYDTTTGSSCYLWRVWGRVGNTGGGGTKLDKFDKLDQAKSEFRKLFQKQTKNKWEDRKIFVKHPGSFFQLDVSYVNDDDVKSNNSSKQFVSVKAGDSNSKLDIRVQEVVAAMFDRGIAADQLKSLNVDLAKMPLGKMTEAQLKDSFSVLAEIEDILDDSNMVGAMRTGRLKQLSNQFYSKCPSTNPVLIDSMKILKSQVELVDELLNIQASNTVISEDGNNDSSTIAPVDAAYARLKTEFLPLDPGGEQYAMLKQYVANTRNASLPGVRSFGNDWESRGLRLLDAFEIQREGEASRFLPSKSLGNRRLLWHGSRISNYVGILSQGLRIAPPEAPVSGYRFGKGVYFADMLGKSANYCRTTGSSEMFIMACDVSLGKTFETSCDMYMEKPQAGTSSTHALSDIVPNPSMSLEMTDRDGMIAPVSNPAAITKDISKVLVPLGSPIQSNLATTPSCDVSEFIVYDQTQVNIRFLLRLTTNPNTKAADGSVGNLVAQATYSASGQSNPSTCNSYGGKHFNVSTSSDDDSDVVLRSRKHRLPNPFYSSDDDSDDDGTSPSKKKYKMSSSCFIRFDQEDQSRPSVSGLKVLNSRTFIEGLRLTIVRGDITESKTEAIVVPSDATLSLGGMVGEKVKQKAGPAFVKEVAEYLAASVQQPASMTSLLPQNIKRLDTTAAGKTIRELATAANVPYLTPYYKVVKKEEISATKEVVCVDAGSGIFHRGQAARNFVGMDTNKKVSLKPTDIPPGVEVFVQSTSHNRKIPNGSSVLLETSVVSNTTPTRTHKTMSTSDACVVAGHGLPAAHVVFVVSPIYNAQSQPSSAEAALKLAVKNALVECAKLGLKTVALPSIGSGRAGYDKGEAAAWIIEAIAVYLEDACISSSQKNQCIEEVCFCLFDNESLEAYRQGILAYEKKRGN